MARSDDKAATPADILNTNLLEIDPWSEVENDVRETQHFAPYRDDPADVPQPSKAQTITETTELTIESDGPHTPTDVAPRGASPNLLDNEDAVEATGELRSILSQQHPPTPSVSSSRSRRQSYSFSKKPTPEPELPFDFNRFQEQLRSASAAPVAKYMKSFLQEFSKRQWSNTEQQKIVHDFLEFIRGKMLVYEPFKSASEAEFDNAREGMEKLIMNRLYPELFPPSIVVRLGKTLTQKLGHGEDLDRDRILNDKIKIYSWVNEKHLDITYGPSNERFLNLAAIEISKLDQFRAPRDKIICVLNCCKVIFGLLRHAGSDESADGFIPFLILTLLRANVANLCSHVTFVQSFRNPDKLSGEAGYYLSSLQGAINFIEVLDRQSLTITDEEYERNVEKSIQRIKLEDSVVPPSPATPIVANLSRTGLQLPSKDLVFEKATGLLNIAKPSLSAVGRLFSQEGQPEDDYISDQDLNQKSRPGSGSQKSHSYIESSAFSSLESDGYDENDRPRLPLRQSTTEAHPGSLSSSAPGESGTPLGSFGAGLRDYFPARPSIPPTPVPQRSRVEITQEEADAAKVKERQETLNTLSAMFENVEIGVIEMVLDEKRGKVGASIDALLEIGGA
ncbi:protein of unknown function [Taphrina deformans PYCC 5710]|uniref:Uncharacterized protein n=1 Tax=Taphrina deformans (strain PYCC 5710 / ATCC 11124 / CBS 356.35 / IMI 108563 / JCM 9778 / NBRC 8474) TaxID=1097556 RepID=R4XI41_TAPDE|nr:protein of unknown function [Taphrina deformans PYCC 5710]|eukprot:CCG84144.1 protein of unknown function [Taphrina deformans PYCC 5710]